MNRYESLLASIKQTCMGFSFEILQRSVKVLSLACQWCSIAALYAIIMNIKINLINFFSEVSINVSKLIYFIIPRNHKVLKT